ncbi:hypothetical protein ACFL47_05300 [Candidatus Latescibacterota bacterium]
MKIPSMVEFIKLKYCFGNHTHCSRYVVLHKLGESQVPDDLFPNEVTRASKLLDNDELKKE